MQLENTVVHDNLQSHSPCSRCSSDAVCWRQWVVHVHVVVLDTSVLLHTAKARSDSNADDIQNKDSKLYEFERSRTIRGWVIDDLAKVFFQGGWFSNCTKFGVNRAASSLHRMRNCGSDALLRFERRTAQSQAVSKIEAKFHTFWPSVKIREGWGECWAGGSSRPYNRTCGIHLIGGCCMV